MKTSAGKKNLKIRHGGNNPTVIKQRLILISILVLTTIILFFFDKPIWLAARSLVAQQPYYNITEWITEFALIPFYAVFVVIFAYALIKKNLYLIRLLVTYVITQLVFALALVRIIKVVVGRGRPGDIPEFLFLSFTFRHNSFPSGHSADAFVSGMFLFYLLQNSKYSACRYLPLVYAFLVASFRVLSNAHYPSDVVAGMTIGILGAWFFISRLEATPTGVTQGDEYHS